MKLLTEAEIIRMGGGVLYANGKKNDNYKKINIREFKCQLCDTLFQTPKQLEIHCQLCLYEQSDNNIKNDNEITIHIII